MLKILQVKFLKVIVNSPGLATRRGLFRGATKMCLDFKDQQR